MTTVRPVPFSLPYKRASVAYERKIATALGDCNSMKRLEYFSRLLDVSLILAIAGPYYPNAFQDEVIP